MLDLVEPPGVLPRAPKDALFLQPQDGRVRVPADRKRQPTGKRLSVHLTPNLQQGFGRT
jgi:hypothetical protein